MAYVVILDRETVTELQSENEFSKPSEWLEANHIVPISIKDELVFEFKDEDLEPAFRFKLAWGS